MVTDRLVAEAFVRLVCPPRVFVPEVVRSPLIVVVASAVVPVAVRLLVVMLFELTVARFAVPVAVIFVPVALPKSKFVILASNELNKLAKKLVEVLFVVTRFVMVAFVADRLSVFVLLAVSVAADRFEAFKLKMVVVPFSTVGPEAVKAPVFIEFAVTDSKVGFVGTAPLY